MGGKVFSPQGVGSLVVEVLGLGVATFTLHLQACCHHNTVP